MEGEPGLAVEATEMEELGLAVEPAGAPAEPPVRLEIPVEAGGTRTRGKTTGERERITGEAGGAKEDRGRMEAVTGGNRVTTIREEEEEEVEDALTVFWRPALTPVQDPAPRYLEPVLRAAPNDASDKLLNSDNKHTTTVTVGLLLNNSYLTLML